MNPATTEVLDAVDEALKHPLPYSLKVKAYQLRYDAKTKHRKPGRARLEAFIALMKKASKPSKTMPKKPVSKLACHSRHKRWSLEPDSGAQIMSPKSVKTEIRAIAWADNFIWQRAKKKAKEACALADGLEADVVAMEAAVFHGFKTVKEWEEVSQRFKRESRKHQNAPGSKKTESP